MGLLALKASSLVKEAATRQVKEMRKLVEQGNVEGAQRLAGRLQEGGVLKRTAMGTPLKQLGAGREGIADLVVGAKDAPVGHEIAVRKSYDPKASMYNPVLPNRKVQMGQELANDPAYAQMFTKGNARAAGNVPYHMGEYVPGKAIGQTPGYHNAAAGLRPAVERGHQAAAKVLGQPAQMNDVIQGGMRVHGDNVRVTPGGQQKIIDHMPFTRDELRAGARGDLTGLQQMYPNVTKKHLAIERQGKGSTLNASRENIVEGYKQLGGSRQARKVRGAKDAVPAVDPAAIRARLAQRGGAAAPAAASAAPAASAARHAGGALHLNQVPTGLRPTPTPGLMSRFHSLPTANKAGIVGGAALGLGALGYGAYRAMRPAQPGTPAPNNLQS